MLSEAKSRLSGKQVKSSNYFLLLTFLLSYSLTLCLSASTISDNSGTSGFTFLKITPSARSASMGECYTGLADDVNAIYYNPAGLAKLTNHEITASHIIWFEDISKSSLGYVHTPFDFGTLAVAVNYVAIPFEKRTVEDDNIYTKTTLADYVVSLAYAKKISEKLSVGVTAKDISEDLDTKKNSGFAGDIGGLYNLRETFAIGLAVQNLGGSTMPSAVRLGVAKKLIDEKLTLLADLYNGLKDGTQSASLGGEYKIGEMFCPRVGYKMRMNNNNQEGMTGLSGGFGIKYNIYELDYAITPYDILGTVHRIDFLVKF